MCNERNQPESRTNTQEFHFCALQNEDAVIEAELTRPATGIPGHWMTEYYKHRVTGDETTNEL
jgi:hypothetical protein